MTRRYETWAVLAGAYKGKDIEERGLLTHTVDTEAGKSLCRVKFDNLTDVGEADSEPTCPICRKRDPRLKTGGPFVLSHLFQMPR